MKRILRKPVTVSFILTILVTLWASANINWGKKHYQSIIKSDGRGYYAHLPALFIYNDLSFHFFDSLDAGKYYNENLYYDYRSFVGGDTVNKYYAGTAIPMMPFFLVAHGLTRITGHHPADGYSKYYQVGINIAALVFMALALWIMVALLRMYRIKEWVIAFAVPLMVFGTNWFYYVVAEPAMSHPYSVFFITLLALLASRWNRAETPKEESRTLVLFALVLGVVTVIRPLNGLSGLFLILFAGDLPGFFRRIGRSLKKPVLLLLSVLVFLFPLFFQLIIYKVQTGHFWVYSYGEEGFDFLHPQIVNLLLSYKKGLFVYTPLLLVALLGYIHLIRDRRWEGSAMLFFLVFMTWLLASWWNWQYGGSFSSRVFIDYFVLFIIPLAFLIQNLRRTVVRWAVLSLFFLITLFCQFQTYQYRYGVIHWEQMDKKAYWDAFLNVDFLKEKKVNP